MQAKLVLKVVRS